MMISKDKIATLPADKQASIEKRIHKVEQTYVSVLPFPLENVYRSPF